MAKLLFAVDHVFEKSEDGRVFTVGGKFPYSKWQEYLAFFDEVIVLARGRAVPDEAHRNLAVSSGAGVTHHLLDGLRGWRRVSHMRDSNALLRKLVKEADAVIGRIPSEFGLMACDRAKAVGKPYLVELVACPWDALWYHGSLAARAYAPLMARRTRRALRDASMVHYVTRAFLQRRYPTSGKAVCASNVVLQTPDPALEQRRRLRIRAIKSGERPIRFGTIGAMLTNLKGLDVAMDALARIQGGLPAFSYHILGEGNPARLKEHAAKLGLADRTGFDGELPGGKAVAGWLDDIDVYLQPSYQEGLPRALIEALNQGCLAIGSTAGGIPELLPPERMHPPGDSVSLGECIARLIEAPEEALATEVARNIETAQTYSYDRSLAAKNEIYAELRAACQGGS